MTREILTADRFFAIAERPKQDVPFPEAGNGAVIPVWGLTPTERTRFERRFQREVAPADRDALLEAFRECLVATCCRNDDGSLVFSESDVSRLGKSHGALVERLFDVAGQLSGITKQDADTAVKNLEPTDSDS